MIDVSSSDPSSPEKDTQSKLFESNSVTEQSSSEMDKDVVATSTEGLETRVSHQLAIADAKLVALSSQEAIDAPVIAGDLIPSEPPPAQLVKEVDSTSKETKATEGKANSPAPHTGEKPAIAEAPKPTDPSDSWCAHAKGLGKPLSKKGEAFTLPSGEACIKIPNFMIEKHRKSWEPFVLGQFYSDPPFQGTLHNIDNGIWSKNYRDIAVSKMEGFAFLFRIPNAATRHRVINQRLWQIEGQTMFVDKWEPGVVPAKPELTSAPIWLELRKVPFQFFNEDGLERITVLVGHSKFLHPMTKKKTNLEVAKVFTIIDPRKPLPEAVNVQFESGEISRVLVSSPWMPPVFELCKEIGHSSKQCPSIPKVCTLCKSKAHVLANCPQAKQQEQPGRKIRRGRSKVQKWKVVEPGTEAGAKRVVPSAEADGKASTTSPSGRTIITKNVSPAPQKELVQTEITHQSKLETEKDKAKGESSGKPYYLRSMSPRRGSASPRSSNSEIQPDSSDVETSDSDLEEGELSQYDLGFETVRYKKKFSGRKDNRGKGPKNI